MRKILLFSVLFLFSCESIRSEIDVSTSISLKDEKGEAYTLSQGKHEFDFSRIGLTETWRLDVTAAAGPVKSSILTLSHLSRLSELSTKESVRFLSTEINQPFHVEVRKQGTFSNPSTQLTINFLDPSTDLKLASSVLNFETRGVTTEAKSDGIEFLKAYQKKKSLSRIAIVAIDMKEIDDVMAQELSAEEYDRLLPFLKAANDYAVRKVIEPWLSARYSSVHWLMGSDTLTDQNIEEKWKSALEQSPIIDFFSFVEVGDQERYSKPLDTLVKKKNQLRLVYSADLYGNAVEPFYVKKHNAALSMAYHGEMIEPLSFLDMMHAWSSGAHLLGVAQTLLENQTNLEFAYTSETHPVTVSVAKEPLPLRDTEAKKEIFTINADTLVSDFLSRNLAGD